jgi:NADH-quinone oxidoreductase subunit C
VPDAPTPQEALEEEPARVRGAPASLSHGQLVLFPDRGSYVELVRALADDDGFSMCVDLCGVDYLLSPHRGLPPEVVPERFEVVLNLLSLSDRKRVRLRVQVPAADPTIPSLFDIYPGTEAMEREVYDMFGIVFTGHPDLSRILMPDDWEGHPLRKDYAVGRIPVQFKAAPGSRPDE